jgi:glucose-1-phosphate thymidylyltransferase
MIKGIIMAGGLATRLHPSTRVINKHLLPIFNKPLIYYPISVLLLAGVKDILIITKKEDYVGFKSLLNDGSHLGIKISYKFQKKPGGIPEGILLAENFIKKNKFIFALGDNIFFGEEFSRILSNIKKFKKGCILFTSKVNDPKRFGILYKDKKNKLRKIIEKPNKPKNNLAVTGLYVYDCLAVNYAKKLKKSKRKEKEITDLNNIYIKKNQAKEIELGRSFTWLDAGTHEAFLSASNLISLHEKRTNSQIGCLEEIAYKNKLIDKLKFKKIIKFTKETNAKNYLKSLLK